MAERTSNFTTEAYLAASQARLNLIFDKFWAQLAARQMVTPQPVQRTAEPENSQTYLHSPAKRPKPPSTQINLRRPRKKLRKLKIHTPVYPWRLAKPGGKHMAANSTDKGQANGTLNTHNRTRWQTYVHEHHEALRRSTASHPQERYRPARHLPIAEQTTTSPQTRHWMNG
ncbi:Hypothetical predicted protein [Pelobates cultripes]|uniref:Uncharacterized protein n=1 Tax=Pelobates cultripes TaxID=61616 RepID=A0AAD1R669_PELCU|nr:Hypothetical predicted protein [Pelobates cultripes]